MKKTLLMLGCTLGIALITNNVSAQVSFTEDFEGTVSWTGSEFFTSTDVPCEGSQSYVSDIHGGFVPNGDDTTVSPSLGTSDGTAVSLMYNYKVLNSDGQPTLNSQDWGTLTVSWGPSAGGPWTVLETISPTNHIESPNCAERTVSFTPAEGTQVFIKFDTELINFMNFIHIHIDDISATQAVSAMDWVNLQWPPTMDLDFGQTGVVYAQGYEPGVTEAPGAGAGVVAWIGVNAENTDPATWTTWVPATFNVQSGNNDEFMATIGSGLQAGTYYYASRFQLEGGSYAYGGTNGIWNGTTNVSGVLTVTCTTTAPAADATQMVCAGSTLADLEIAGDQILWYTAATEGFPMSEMTVVSDGAIYYAAQIPENGCESVERTAITVDVIVTPAPTGEAVQIFEYTDPNELPMIPVTEIEVVTSEGAIVQYYYTEEDAENGENPLNGNQVLEGGHTYYVTQTIGGCESEPFAVTVDVVLGGEDFTAGSLKCYPNPVQDAFTVSYTEVISSVTVYNVVGQQVLSKQFDAAEAQLDMSQLQAGTYIVKIAAADAVKTIKVVKQ